MIFSDNLDSKSFIHSPVDDERGRDDDEEREIEHVDGAHDVDIPHELGNDARCFIERRLGEGRVVFQHCRVSHEIARLQRSGIGGECGERENHGDWEVGFFNHY